MSRKSGINAAVSLLQGDEDEPGSDRNGGILDTLNTRGLFSTQSVGFIDFSTLRRV
jgi:hypothetical protein